MLAIDIFRKKGRVRVYAEFDGIPYEGSVVNMGLKTAGGEICYLIGVRKSIRDTIGKGDGDLIHVRIRILESTPRGSTFEDSP